jgi:RING finger protein 121
MMHTAPLKTPTITPHRRTLPPIQVYTFFLAVYKVAWTMGVAGYVLLILDLFGVGLLLNLMGLPAGTSLILLWYG